MIAKATFHQQLRDLWDTVETKNSIKSPFFSYQWHVTWHQIFGNGYEPYILVVDDGIIAPFAKKGTEVHFSGGEEISDYQDLIGLEDKKEHAWREILTQMQSDEITSIRFRNVPADSPTITFFQTIPQAIIEQEDTTPTMPLPDSWDRFIESLPYKPRHELERKIRKFEREHTTIHIEESINVGSDIHILLRLMRKDHKKLTFLTPEMATFFERIAITFSREISLLILYMDDKPAASTLSFICDNASLLYNSGFDKECCKNAGFYLKAMTIKHAIEKGLKKYNFLQGHERYKYELGGNDFPVHAISYTLPNAV